MKKLIGFLLIFALAAGMLAGCGMDRRGNNSVVETPLIDQNLIPTASPMISPDVDNGTVNDTDGIIEEHDNGSATADLPQSGAGSNESPIPEKPDASMHP